MILDKYIPGSAQGVLANPLVIDITYAELVDKISLSALVAGQKYRITDYRTAYNMPNVTPAEKIVCTVEPLLVTANSVNTLSMYAYSEAFPQDEIYYDIANNQTMVPGCDMGYIYRRIDKLKNIDIGFDWRNVKFRRWQIEVSNWLVGTTYNIGAVVKNPANTDLYISLTSSNIGNSVSVYHSEYWRKFEWSDLSYVSPTQGDNWELAIIQENDPIYIPLNGEYIDVNMFSGGMTDVYNVRIDGNISDIVGNNNSVFMGAVSNCEITETFYNNTIGINFKFNKFRNSRFWGNSIGSGFMNNIIEIDFAQNSIGNNFSSNVIKSMVGNTVASGFMDNDIGTGFAFNSIGIGFSHNRIGDNVSSNIIGISVTYLVTNTLTNSYLPTNTRKLIITDAVSIDLTDCVLVTTPSTIIKTPNNTVLAKQLNNSGAEIIFDPQSDVIYSIKEYTALLSETGYAATSGLLIAGQTYYIASYVAGDDFANVGGTNVTGNTFTASGTTPTTWTNSSILVSVGISAPAVTLLTNGLSAAIVWTYSAVGTYIGTLSGAFTENKTVFSYPPLGDDKSVEVEWTSANVITVKTYETGALKDGLLVKFPLTIKVYP